MGEEKLTRGQRPGVPEGLRRCIVAAVALLVGGPAAAVSYTQMFSLIDGRIGFLAAATIPLTIDGLMLGAASVIFVRHRDARRGGLLPWVTVILAVGASVTANSLAVDGDVIAHVIAAWPGLAFILAFELIVMLTREVKRANRAVATTKAPAPTVTKQAASPPAEGRKLAPVPDAPKGRGTSRRDEVVRAIEAAGGVESVTIADVVRRTGVPEPTVRRHYNAVRDGQATVTGRAASAT